MVMRMGRQIATNENNKRQALKLMAIPLWYHMGCKHLNIPRPPVPPKQYFLRLLRMALPTKENCCYNVLVPLFQAVVLAFVSNVRRIMRRNNKYSPCDLNVGITCNDVMVIAGCGCTCNFLLYSTSSANW